MHAFYILSPKLGTCARNQSKGVFLLASEQLILLLQSCLEPSTVRGKWRRAFALGRLSIKHRGPGIIRKEWGALTLASRAAPGWGGMGCLLPQ